jgi:hypothetical protein
MKLQTNGIHASKPVCAQDDVSVVESSSTHTEVTTNMPDMIIKNKEGKTRILIHVEIPANINVMQKEAE